MGIRQSTPSDFSGFQNKKNSFKLKKLALGSEIPLMAHVSRKTVGQSSE